MATNNNSFIQRGITLLELLVVLAIIGVMVALVVPRLGNHDLVSLQAQTREVVAMLKFARRSAMIHGAPSEVQLFPAETAGVQSRKPEAANVPGRWVAKGASLSWGGARKANENAEISITFYPGGGCSGGEIMLSQGQYQARITVHPLTGKTQADVQKQGV